MNIIEHLSEEIAQQSRNGRTDMYIETVLLKELGYKVEDDSDRQFIDRATLETLMRKYNFKNKLKTSISPIILNEEHNINKEKSKDKSREEI